MVWACGKNGDDWVSECGGGGEVVWVGAARLGGNVSKMTWMSLVCTLNGQCSGLCGEASNRGKRDVRHFGLVVSTPAWDGTGREIDSWQCWIYIPCSLSIRLLESLRGSLGTYVLDTKIGLKKSLTLAERGRKERFKNK